MLDGGRKDIKSLSILFLLNNYIFKRQEFLKASHTTKSLFD